jgi:hypothetical protein
MLPNLVVIGAARCGTTSLHMYLDAHPDVFMARHKELRFFVAEEAWGRGLDWYRAQFPDRGACVYGESSPAYTMYPIHRGVPERMAEIIPHARLVYLVRDPVARIVSNVHLSLRTGSATGDLATVLGSSGERYLAGSRYGTQLERYLRVFRDDRIMVVDFDDLVGQTDATMRSVFAFARVDPDRGSDDLTKVWNRSAGHGRKHLVGRAVVHGIDGVLGKERSHRLRRFVPAWAKRPFTRSVPAPVADRETLEWLTDALAPEAARLRALTGRPFAGWSV